MRNIGLPLKKAQIVRLDGQIYEVERDVEWWPDFQAWGSVKLVGLYPPVFTHKGGIEIVENTLDI